MVDSVKRPFDVFVIRNVGTVDKRSRMKPEDLGCSPIGHNEQVPVGIDVKIGVPDDPVVLEMFRYDVVVIHIPDVALPFLENPTVFSTIPKYRHLSIKVKNILLRVQRINLY